MKPGRFRIEFGQAAIGDDADVLGQILVPQFNLAVWRGAGENLSRSAYMQSLDLDSLGQANPLRDNYFKSLFSLPVSSSPSQRLAMIAALTANLRTADFPAEAPSGINQPHDDFTRRDLASALYDLTTHFAASIGKRSRVTLLIFYPDGNHFWHSDGGPARGIITLRGNKGTIWRPDSSLVGQTCSYGTYWGDVEPEKQDFIQSIEPGDMAIFKCKNHKNPLVHATPESNEPRLVAIMGPSP
jgi:hypothetical protein